MTIPHRDKVNKSRSDRRTRSGPVPQDAPPKSNGKSLRGASLLFGGLFVPILRRSIRLKRRK
jgi:hypothetical protein